MSVAQIIADIAPELSTVDTDRRDRLIVIAQGQLSSSVFGDHYDYAVALKVCHILTLANRSGSAGVITSETEGDLTRSYGISGLTMSRLDTTSYGMELKNLINSLSIGAMTILV